MDWELAQVNVAGTVAALTSPRLAGFLELLDPVDAEARRSPGFVWRPDPAGVALADLRLFGDPMRSVVNLSVWESLAALRAYVFSGQHVAALRRRADWFTRPAEPATALWWVPAGHRPTFAEARDRLDRLRRDGPGPAAFTLTRPHAAPADGAPAAPRLG